MIEERKRNADREIERVLLRARYQELVAHVADPHRGIRNGLRTRQATFVRGGALLGSQGAQVRALLGGSARLCGALEPALQKRSRIARIGEGATRRAHERGARGERSSFGALFCAHVL